MILLLAGFVNNAYQFIAVSSLQYLNFKK